jgi:hypothetical protein
MQEQQLSGMVGRTTEISPTHKLQGFLGLPESTSCIHEEKNKTTMKKKKRPS